MQRGRTQKEGRQLHSFEDSAGHLARRRRSLSLVWSIERVTNRELPSLGAPTLTTAERSGPFRETQLSLYPLSDRSDKVLL